MGVFSKGSNTVEEYEEWVDYIPRTHNHRITGNVMCSGCPKYCMGKFCRGKKYHNIQDRRRNFELPEFLGGTKYLDLPEFTADTEFKREFKEAYSRRIQIEYIVKIGSCVMHYKKNRLYGELIWVRKGKARVMLSSGERVTWATTDVIPKESKTN